jgi:uncharacterized protein
VAEITIHKLKWPNIPHYRHAGWILGEDDFGHWVSIRVPTPIYRGEELLFQDVNGGLLLVPRDETWLAWFPEFGEFELYVDIATNLIWTSDSVTVIDLDLDVVRMRDGEVRLLDEEEFRHHQVELAYPSALVERASRQAKDVFEAVTVGLEPFGGRRAAQWQQKKTSP